MGRVGHFHKLPLTFWCKSAAAASDQWDQKRESGTATVGEPRRVTNSSVVAERARSLGTN